MKKYKELWFPDFDVITPGAVYREWSHKENVVLNYVKNTDTLVQAGGNAGLFPISLSTVFNRIITFEPAEKTYECFVQNLKERPEITNIELHYAAVGATETTGKVYFPEGIKNAGAHAVEYDENGPTCIMTIDSFDLDSMDLLWLDIEGFELEALAGAAESIKKFKPTIILENKGLIKGYGGNVHGCDKVVEHMEEVYGYKKVARLLRDDIFVSIE